MPLTYLIDENLRGGFRKSLFNAAWASGFPIDLLQVGDEGAPALGAQDPQVIAWCEAHQRVLISLDKKSLPGHLANHLSLGGHCQGIFVILPGVRWNRVLDELVLLCHASLPGEYQDRILFLPM